MRACVLTLKSEEAPASSVSLLAMPMHCSYFKTARDQTCDGYSTMLLKFLVLTLIKLGCLFLALTRS